MTALSEADYQRRSELLRAFEPFGEVAYIGPGMVAVTCPICACPLRVEFRGRRARFCCTQGCDGENVTAAIGALAL